MSVIRWRVARRLLLVLAFHGGAGGGELSQLVRSRAAIHVALTASSWPA